MKPNFTFLALTSANLALIVANPVPEGSVVVAAPVPANTPPVTTWAWETLRLVDDDEWLMVVYEKEGSQCGGGSITSGLKDTCYVAFKEICRLEMLAEAGSDGWKFQLKKGSCSDTAVKTVDVEPGKGKSLKGDEMPKGVKFVSVSSK